MGVLTANEQLKARLQSIGSTVRKAGGTFLFQHGQEVSGVFLITQGLIRLGLEADLAGYPSRQLGPGSLVGLPATLSHSRYSLTAEVVEDCELTFVPAAELCELLRSQPELCFDVTQILAEELSETRVALERVRRPGR